MLQQTLATTASLPFYPASTQPYSETNSYYSQMRREVLALINACMQVRKGPEHVYRRARALHGARVCMRVHICTSCSANEHLC